MKRFVVVALLVVVGLIGCAAPMRYSQSMARPTGYQPPTQTAQPPVIVGGMVPVDVENPSLLEQEVLIFAGSDPVDVIPDPRNGKWMYSRPAFKAFRIGSANSENNWHRYARIMLPRNSSFVLAGRTMNFWGKGSLYFVYFSTGSNPFAVRYTMVTPSYPPAEAGGLVMLQIQPIMPFGQGPMNIEYTIDLRSVGQGIANGITNQIYRR